MLRARVAVGLSLAAAAVAAAAIFVPAEGAPRAAAADDCTSGESSYTSDTLHDVRSFSDAMAIVTGVKEEIPPPPRHSPEGYAGLIPRVVTMRVERVLWRRPNSPRPPATSRYTDFGWWGELDDRVPMRICGDTRMELGRRYLAPIVRQNGTWYPFFSVRLLLDGDLVVGGVDGGEPNHAHQALVGRRVAGAVRMVARAKPYRSVVLHPEGSPARRWQRVNRDDYRLWRERPGMRTIVDSGVTDRSRWQLYMRLPRRGGMCVGMRVRPLWPGPGSGSGERCGARRIPLDGLDLALFSAAERGTFAYGRTGPRVWAVRVRFDGEPWQRIDTAFTPIPPGGRGRFWVAPAEGDCPMVMVQALGRGDRVLGERRSPPPPRAPREGEPDPYAAC
jgi:hypothetical protein